MAKKKKELTVEEMLEEALVKEEEQPYQVPGNWVWTYLTKGYAECLDRFRKPINSSERANRNGDVPYYGATGQVGWIDDYLTNENLVLLGEDGAPFFDYLKDKAYLIDGKSWVNNHAHILKSFYGENGNKFIAHYLNIFNYKDFVNGTTRLKLTQSSLNTIPVPLPPLAEQQRIVDRIENLFEKLDQAKDLIQEALDNFENRKSAILHKAFTGELTKKWREEHGVGLESWEEVTIGEIANVKGGKRLPKGQSLVNENTGFPYIKAGDLKHGTVMLEKIQYLTPEIHEQIKNYTVTAGDVYITIVGACIGDVGIIPETVDGANLTENAAKITNLSCNSSYLGIVMASNMVQRQIKNRIASATLGKLSLQNIKLLEINLPSISEQQEIVRILDDFFEKEQNANDLCDLIDQIEAMKKTILGQAFRGKLGTNEPKEQSSLELLKLLISEKKIR